MPLGIPPESAQKFGLRICTSDRLDGFGVDAGFLECLRIRRKSAQKQATQTFVELDRMTDGLGKVPGMDKDIEAQLRRKLCPVYLGGRVAADRVGSSAVGRVNRPGFPGDSKPWKGWSHARTELIIIEAVSP
jgi:hypothetical protein